MRRDGGKYSFVMAGDEVGGGAVDGEELDSVGWGMVRGSLTVGCGDLVCMLG